MAHRWRPAGPPAGRLRWDFAGNEWRADRTRDGAALLVKRNAFVQQFSSPADRRRKGPKSRLGHQAGGQVESFSDPWLRQKDRLRMAASLAVAFVTPIMGTTFLEFDADASTAASLRQIVHGILPGGRAQGSWLGG
jgi:hypothetical protein